MIWWVILAIIAAFCWACSNIIDKFALNRHKPIVIMAFLSFLSIIVAVVVYFFHGFQSLTPTQMLLGLLLGALYFIGIYFYCIALSGGEVSRIIPLFSIIPLFVLIFSVVFLKEILPAVKYLGIFLIVAGSFLISFKKKKIIPDKYFWYVVIASVFFAADSVLMDYLLISIDYWTVFSYERIGDFLLILPFMFIYRKDITFLLKKKKQALLISSSEVFNIIGLFLITIATSLGPVALVRALSQIQDFFVLMLSVVISLFVPKMFKEEINSKILLIKFAAIILLIAGIIIITS